ncbi:MAG: hypothetical protein LUD03_06790 [Firmicutes bacterium]|nr:hypothetical protein [Bacillota bacterium]
MDSEKENKDLPQDINEVKEDVPDTDALAEEAEAKSDKIIDEILSYYEDNPSEPVLDTEKAEEDVPRQVNKLKQTASAVSAAVPRVVNAVIPEDKKGRGKYLYMIIAAVLIIIIGFFAGFIAFGASDEKVDSKKEELQKTDTSYLRAKSENTTLTASIEALEENGENIEKTFDSVVEYQKQYDTLEEEYSEYQSQLDSLTSDYDQLKSEYDELSEQLTKLKTQTVTLTPGTYTVGTHLAAGNYSVTGDGSMLAADSNSSLKINTILDDDAYECTLSGGDIIKLETTAKFTPTEG